MSKPPTKRQAIRVLAAFFERNGYVRLQNAKRLAKEGPQKYKKGYEARLMAKSESELATMQTLLGVLNIKPGRPFAKANQFCLPIYGNEQIDRFITLIGKQ